MTHPPIRVILVAAALFAMPIQPEARADAGPAAKAPGEVDFAISCGPAAQTTFKQAVWTLHSFWYPEALKAFTAITEAEPGCAMGYWGIAMSHWYPLWYPPSPAALKAGSEAVAGPLREVNGSLFSGPEIVTSQARLARTWTRLLYHRQRWILQVRGCGL